jgi:hypothetical protein
LPMVTSKSEVPGLFLAGNLRGILKLKKEKDPFI